MTRDEAQAYAEKTVIEGCRRLMPMVATYPRAFYAFKDSLRALSEKIATDRVDSADIATLAGLAMSLLREGTLLQVNAGTTRLPDDPREDPTEDPIEEQPEPSN